MSFCKEKIGIDPDVKGYQLYILAPELEEKMGGVYLPDSYLKDQKRRQNIGVVLKKGPSAFLDRFKDRECEIGDWVVYAIREREPQYVGEHTCYYVADENILAILTPEDVKVILATGK